MRKPRFAIIGLGRLGQACGEAIAGTEELAIAGVVRREESMGRPLPLSFGDIPVVPHVSGLGNIDGALICVPPALVLDTARELLQHRIPIVEAAILPALAGCAHQQAIHRVALRHRVAAVVGAGWDPGALPLFQGLFTVLTPKGKSEMRDQPGVSLHHTLAARLVPGVKDALCTERRSASGKLQRYVYLELRPGADIGGTMREIQNDPLFLDEETVVLPVESIDALEEAGHGVVFERWGISAGKAHQRFLLEGCFDLPSVAAQIMVAAGRALASLAPGAYSLAEIPLAALWRDLRLGTD